MSLEHLFVFDNNVLVSAFLFRASTPRQSFDLAQSLGSIVYSDETIDELWNVLVRPKFDRYLSLSERITLLTGFEQVAQQISLEHNVVLCRDPKDDKFLNLALSANAECIVSGDADLLVLEEIFSIPILTPAQFIQKYNNIS